MTTPPPPPPAPPTLNLPPDVVDKLAPHHSWDDWWYTQGATVGSAVIALLAAVVAFLAIRYQVGAEEKRRRHAQRLEVVTNALQLLREIKDWSEASQPFRRPESLGGQKYEEYFDQQVELLDAKLLWNQMGNQALHVDLFWKIAKQSVGQDLSDSFYDFRNDLRDAVSKD
jgi:hypothetical protein